jgi:hypothetical protein
MKDFKPFISLTAIILFIAVISFFIRKKLTEQGKREVLINDIQKKLDQEFNISAGIVNQQQYDAALNEAAAKMLTTPERLAKAIKSYYNLELYGNKESLSKWYNDFYKNLELSKIVYADLSKYERTLSDGTKIIFSNKEDYYKDIEQRIIDKYAGLVADADLKEFIKNGDFKKAITNWVYFAIKDGIITQEELKKPYLSKSKQLELIFKQEYQAKNLIVLTRPESAKNEALQGLNSLSLENYIKLRFRQVLNSFQINFNQLVFSRPFEFEEWKKYSDLRNTNVNDDFYKYHIAQVLKTNSLAQANIINPY